MVPYHTLTFVTPVVCHSKSVFRYSTFNQPTFRTRSQYIRQIIRRSTLTMQDTSIAVPKVPTLYHVPWFCSSIPYMLSLELQIPSSQFSINQISEATLKVSPEIGDLSPRRVVPFMHLPDGSCMLEAGAIVLYLCETFDQQGKLHPLPGSKERSKFLQAVVYTVSECYKAAVDVFILGYGVDPASRDQNELKRRSEKYHRVVTDHLKKELKNSKFYLGDQFSVADIMFAYILMCAENCRAGLIEDEILKKYHDRLKLRESYQSLFNPAKMAQV